MAVYYYTQPSHLWFPQPALDWWDVLDGLLSSPPEQRPACGRSRCKRIIADSTPKPWGSVVDVRGFAEGELRVRVEEEGRRLSVRGVAVTGDEGGDFDRREMQRHLDIPENVDLETLRVVYTDRCGGRLVVRALTHPREERDADKAAKKEGVTVLFGSKDDDTTGKDLDVTRDASQRENTEVTVQKNTELDPKPETLPKGTGTEEKTSDAEKQKTKPAEKDLTLTCNLTGFDPSNVKVKVDEGHLIVEATQEVEDEDFMIRRRFYKTMAVPSDADPGSVKCALSKDGQLRMTMSPRDVAKDSQPKTVPIAFD